MQSNTLTSIAMLIEIPENELNTLPEEAKNELESAYTVNSGILEADEIAAELKRLYVHHITNSILSDLAERFSLNPDTLKNLPQGAKSVILIQYENYNNYTEMYHIIQKCIQISSLSEAAKLLNTTVLQLEEKYSYETLSQLCGTYDMLHGIESDSTVIKEMNAVLTESGGAK